MLCKRAFKRQGSLQVHMGIHYEEKPYVCKFCSKAFKQYVALKVHERIHSDAKSYVCETCKKGFKTSSRLRCHERIHSGEKPHVCKTCKKGFTRSSHLRLHERIHSKEKPYACKACNKAFARLDHCKAHEIIHSQENPHVSKTSRKEFSRLVNLNVHKNIHTVEQYDLRIDSGKRPYICYECGKTFTKRAYVVKHYRIIHTRHCGISKKPSLKGENHGIKEKSANEITAKMLGHKRPKKSPFTVQLFGCGACDEMFVEETQFLMHCSLHSSYGDCSGELIFRSCCRRFHSIEGLEESFSIGDRSKLLGNEDVVGTSQRWF